MAQLPVIHTIQAPDAPQHTGRLQKILQKLKTENRIRDFTTLGVDEDLSSLTDSMEEEDLILVVLTNQLESRKEQIENRFRALKTKQPGIRIAEIIVDNLVYDNEFITYPTDLRPIRNREDMEAVWSGIEQSLKDLFPVKTIPEPVHPQPTDWSKYLKIAGIFVGAILVFFVVRGLVDGESAGPLMTDDFSDANMNSWTVVDEGTISAPSNWSVVRGEVQQSSNIYSPDASATNNRKGTFAYYNNPEAFSWTNYSLSAVLRSTDNDGIGLMFRYQNRNNYYKLDLDEQRNFRKLFKVVNGVETTLAHVEEPGYIQDAYFTLEVRSIGNQIQVFQDGIDIFGGPITDNFNSLTSGSVALYSLGNQNSYFDNVSVDPQ